MLLGVSGAVSLPSGTVTFLFTDVESSSVVAQQQPETWEAMQARQQVILRTAIDGHHGSIFKTLGDGVCAAFPTARDGLQAALEAQQALECENWGQSPVHVRMGIHTGEAQARDDDYTGYLTLTRAQRLMAAAHGGQILLSNASAELVRGGLPANASLRDLGEHRLKNLLSPEHIWQLLAPHIPADFPPVTSLNSLPNNLPVQLTSFVGRQAEISQVRSLMGTHRLITLTGTGGTGKTRLALQVAAEVLDSYKDGVWLVELGPLSDPALVPNAVASVLGVREQPGRPLMATLLDWLRDRELLLLLDNCEHLILACAEFAEAVLRCSRGSCILASSREALCIEGEISYRVPSLESPDPARTPCIRAEELIQFTAVRLFVERLSEAVGTFAITEANAPAIVQICHRLDGIPLALELAAVRVKVLTVEQIAERLDDRFRLLTGGSRTALQRHQTLRSLIDWSHSLLTGSEQTLLRRLSVFAGGWTLEAAEQVCASDGIESSEVLDLLTRLVDKSLVAVVRDAHHARYRMLETIRDYAREKLGESGEAASIRNRHLDLMQDLAARAEPKIYSREEMIWLERLDAEIDNMRTALEWAHTREDPEAGLRLVGALSFYWSTRDYWHDSQKWIREALGHAGAEKRTTGRAKALLGLGYFMTMTDHPPEAKLCLEESLSIAREVGEEKVVVLALAWLSWAFAFLGDFAAMRAVVEEGLTLARELDDRLAIAMLWLGSANIDHVQGRYPEAESYYQDAARLLREIGDRNFLAFAVRRLGYLALARGDPKQAFALCVESLEKNHEIADRRGVAASLTAISCLSATGGDATRAARLHGASDALLESFGGHLIPMDQRDQESCARAVRLEIGEAAYAQAYAEGRAMDMEQARLYALEQPPA